MCQRYFWTGMYQYFKRTLKACTGCSLSNITQNRCADLVYSFLINTPLQVLFVDIYDAVTETILMRRNTTSLVHVVWPLSESANQQRNKTHLSLLQRLWRFVCALDFPTQLWLTTTKTFLVFLLRLLHFLISTFMFYLLKIMIQWLFSASTSFSNTVPLFFAMSMATIMLLLKVFLCLCMHGIMRLLFAFICPIACWLLDGSLTFLLNSR